MEDSKKNPCHSSVNQGQGGQRAAQVVVEVAVRRVVGVAGAVPKGRRLDHFVLTALAVIVANALRAYANVMSTMKYVPLYAWSGPFDQALVLYRRMIYNGVSPNKFTFPFVLKACSGLSALEDGRKIHDDAVRAGLESDVFVATALIDMYSKCGCLDSAYQVFEKMWQRDVLAWSSMATVRLAIRQGRRSIPGTWPNSGTGPEKRALGRPGLSKCYGRPLHAIRAALRNTRATIKSGMTAVAASWPASADLQPAAADYCLLLPSKDMLHAPTVPGRPSLAGQDMPSLACGQDRGLTGLPHQLCSTSPSRPSIAALGLQIARDSLEIIRENWCCGYWTLGGAVPSSCALELKRFSGSPEMPRRIRNRFGCNKTHNSQDSKISRYLPEIGD
ncbi:hypothetical protein EJ110_NYTH39189 [Nymphaea thermarum]|nr:hypothetical protein EJ110_NYTH39189 [Nymphaea thermarum]